MRGYTELLSRYEHSEKDYRDVKNFLCTAFEDGIGFGETKKIKEIAKNAIRLGMSDVFIQKITELPLEEIEQLRKELDKPQ